MKSIIFASTPLLTPQLREWAMMQATDDEIVAGIIEVQEKGGTELGAVIQKLKQKRQDRERTNPWPSTVLDRNGQGG